MSFKPTFKAQDIHLKRSYIIIISIETYFRSAIKLNIFYMYFVANYKLTTFVLKMIKKEEKRRVSILKRQMVVSKRVERARGREDDTELIISQH